MILIDAAVLIWIGEETLGKTQREIDTAFLGLKYEPVHQSSLEKVYKIGEEAKPVGLPQKN